MHVFITNGLSIYIVIYGMVCLAQMASESLIRLQYCYILINLTYNTPATNKQSIIYGKGVSISQSHYYCNQRGMNSIHESVDIIIHYFVITFTSCCIFT